MSFNNSVILEGNPTSEPKLIQEDKSLFIVFTLATQDAYTDKNKQIVKANPVFHDVFVFKPHLIELMGGITTKDRLKITGRISYQPIEAYDSEGNKLLIKKASIIAGMVQPAPLIKANNTNQEPT